ncbi:ATP-binding protein [Marinicrinis lubricantis]|uniref:histidine kinase n=1 Tax=Marinicrinis lubricantis TaxID=2086470 RepID=A0ABW1IRF2_9BACL
MAALSNLFGIMRKYNKTIWMVVLFIFIITGIRLSWLNFIKPIEHPKAEQGILDLRGWTFPENETIRLNGEWEFYPSRLLSPGEDQGFSIPNTIQVPGTWEDAFSNEEKDSYYFGTYRLRILLDEELKQTYRLRVKDIVAASAVYINGQFAAGTGHPSEHKDGYQARDIPYSVDVLPGEKNIDILIHVSSHIKKGGIIDSIEFGTYESVNRYTLLSQSLQILLCIVLLIHGLYALILYFLGTFNKALYYFALLMLSAIVSVLVVDDRQLLVWVEMPFEVSTKISLLSYIFVASFIPAVLYYLLPEFGNRKIMQWFAFYCTLYSILIIISPSSYIRTPSIMLLLSIVLVSSIIISISLLRNTLKKHKDAIYLLLGCVSIAVNIAWTAIEGRTAFETMHYPFDLIIAVLCFATFWFKRFFRMNEETKQLANRLQLANQRKDEFLVNTSHELRNPLHGIMNITQSVLDDTVQPIHEHHRKKLEMQIAVSRRLSLMLNDLLDVARLKESTIQLKLQHIRIQNVAAGVREMLTYMLNGKHIQLHINIPDDFPAVKADENRVIQILFNLFHNAIKFTDEGYISLSCEISQGMAAIRIQDTGIGMDENTLRRIFLPYEQGESNMTRAGGGFGLGLSICKELVELHGGMLQATSMIGQGSVFTFTLPLADTDTDTDSSFVEMASLTNLSALETAAASTFEEAGAIVADMASSKPRILVVDDDPINLQILTDMIGTAQYDIAASTNAAEALALLENQHFDLVISDVMMPNISGYEFTKAIRKRFTLSELPVLLLTARSRSEDIYAGFQAGANDYVTKPVEPLELRSRVRALTELQLSIEERLRIEAAWLQAQMRPHFLFNTMNAIAALGAMDIEKMQKLLEEFSNYLRMSFDFHNTDKVVPLERELSRVRSYLYIEKERFVDLIEVSWKVDAGTSVMLPPLSIQTLVENAVNHGLLPRRGGRIEIRIMDAGDHVHISISDNGIGMSEEKLNQLFTAAGIDKGIGVRNTDRRLRQLYGKGLYIESTPNGGTQVAFQIPKIKE